MTSVRCGSAGTGLAAYKMGVLGGSLVSQPLQVQRLRGSLVSQPNGVVGGAQWEGRSSAGLGLAARRREWADSFRCAPRVLVSQLMVYGVHMGLSLGRRDSRASDAMKGKGRDDNVELIN